MQVLDRNLGLGAGGWFFLFLGRELQGSSGAPGREPRVYYRQEAWGGNKVRQDLSRCRVGGCARMRTRGGGHGEWHLQSISPTAARDRTG